MAGGMRGWSGRETGREPPVEMILATRWKLHQGGRDGEMRKECSPREGLAIAEPHRPWDTGVLSPHGGPLRGGERFRSDRRELRAAG